MNYDEYFNYTKDKAVNICNCTDKQFTFNVTMQNMTYLYTKVSSIYVVT